MAENTTHKPLTILIVGAGIGGLTAAVGLRSQGHKLFEKSRLAEEIGAAVHIAPNAHGILRRFGIFPETFGANPIERLVEYDESGSLLADIDIARTASLWQHPWLLCHRVQLHNELKKVATSEEGMTSPVVLRTSSRVINVSLADATVTLEDGSTFSGDLVIGADGVSSVTRRLVAENVTPYRSGKRAFRFMIPQEKFRDCPNLQHFVERTGVMHIWFGKDRRLIMYPCNNNTAMNIAAIHPSDLSAAKGDDWDEGGSKEALLAAYKDFPPDVQALLNVTDGSRVKVWSLLDMDRIPRWTIGRLVLLGDAAHPFTPHQGQGAGVAMEDAASLTALLPAETQPEDLPERLALYQKLRDERAHKIQEVSRLMGRDLDDESRGKLNMFEFTQYNFGHDEWHNSKHALKKLLWSQSNMHWCQPVSFGPMPSPRQDDYGRPIPSHDSKAVTHSVRFRTSKTYLQTLFPSPAFSFPSLGTVVEASFVCTELDKMRWLGGKGYNMFGLWIHGVQYAKKDGTTLHGRFLPILFENLTDPIITGREGVGMPKLYADINVARTGSTTSFSCSWRGREFFNIVMDGLQDAASSDPLPVIKAADRVDSRKDDGFFIHRYLPAVGKPGEVDAEYTVFVEDGLATTPQIVTRTLRASSSRIKIDAGDWTTLPTLHHIASGLAEIPIFSIVEAKTEEACGVADLSQARRID